MPSDVYDSWKRRRGRLAAPAGFADAVMDAVRAFESRRQQWFLGRLIFTVVASRAGRAGLMAFALLVFALRLAAVVSLFVVNFSNPLE